MHTSIEDITRSSVCLINAKSTKNKLNIFGVGTSMMGSSQSLNMTSVDDLIGEVNSRRQLDSNMTKVFHRGDCTYFLFFLYYVYSIYFLFAYM